MAPPPGARQAYHALSLGFYEGEFLRRVDPQHRSLRQFFQDEIAHPPRARFLHPSSRNDPDTRFARLEAPTLLERLRGFPIPLTLAALYPRSNLCRTLVVTRAGCPHSYRVYICNLQVPAGGGVGTARALPFGHAGAYGAPGAGGTFAYADPEAGLAYAYVTNRMGTDLSGYPRDVALRAALPVE